VIGIFVGFVSLLLNLIWVPALYDGRRNEGGEGVLFQILAVEAVTSMLLGMLLLVAVIAMRFSTSLALRLHCVYALLKVGASLLSLGCVGMLLGEHHWLMPYGSMTVIGTIYPVVVWFATRELRRATAE
jgi:hypothetical protein